MLKHQEQGLGLLFALQRNGLPPNKQTKEVPEPGSVSVIPGT